MKFLLVLVLTAAAIGCGGYGSSYNSMTGGGAAPKITSLSPSSVTNGHATFTLTITGTGFTAGSVVYWAMSPIASSSTGYTSTTQLTATISASMVANPTASPGIPVYVHTSAGNSNTVYFMVN